MNEPMWVVTVRGKESEAWIARPVGAQSEPFRKITASHMDVPTLEDLTQLKHSRKVTISAGATTKARDPGRTAHRKATHFFKDASRMNSNSDVTSCR
ncbi:MAG TPA: hypothetical protein VNM72_08305 [Blastocatellia bacterium]|nr:hypothetical protein [Blastocatellia bacterium]